MAGSQVKSKCCKHRGITLLNSFSPKFTTTSGEEKTILLMNQMYIRNQSCNSKLHLKKAVRATTAARETSSSMLPSTEFLELSPFPLSPPFSAGDWLMTDITCSRNECESTKCCENACCPSQGIPNKVKLSRCSRVFKLLWLAIKQ